MHFTRINTFIEIYKTLKKEKGTRARSGLARPNGASRCGLVVLQKVPCFLQNQIKPKQLFVSLCYFSLNTPPFSLFTLSGPSLKF